MGRYAIFSFLSCLYYYYGDREIFIFPVQLTTCRIGNLTRLIHTLATCVTILIRRDVCWSERKKSMQEVLILLPWAAWIGYRRT